MKNITTTTKQARIYGRFSSKPQEKGDSIRRQIEGAKAYAAKKENNFSIIGKPYFDEGVSGKAGLNLEREFGRLLNEAKSGELILVEALDRLGRQNPFVLSNLIYQTVQKGLEIHSWQDNKIINAENIEELGTQFSIFTGAAVGHQENRRKIIRIKETVELTISESGKGIITKGILRFTPQCFKWDDTNKTIFINESIAETVRFIFSEYNKGVGTTSIARMLNDKKAKSFYTGETKGIWYGNTVKYILICECYCGVLSINGNKFNILPKVVSNSVFDKAQMLMARNTTRKGNLTGRTNNIFGSITHCKHCGARVKANRAGKHSYMYCCTNALLKACKHKNTMLNARYVESGFFDTFFGSKASSILRNDNRNIALKEQIEVCKAKLDRLNKAIDNLYDMAEQGDEIAKKRIDERKNERFTVENEMTVLKGQIVEDNQYDENIMSLKGLIDGKLITWKGIETKPLKLKATALGKKLGLSDITIYKTPIEKALADNAARKKMSLILPSIISRVEFDCPNASVEAFNKDGKSMGTYSIKRNRKAS